MLRRVRRMYAAPPADDPAWVPTQMAVSYVPLDIAAGTQLASQDTGVGGIYSHLEDLGHEVVKFPETIRFQVATADGRDPYVAAGVPPYRT